MLVVWRNKNKISVCLIIFPSEVPRAWSHISPRWHPGHITDILTSLFWLNIMTGYFWSLFFSQIVWDKKCCDTFISRQMRSSLWGCCEEWGVLPRPRLSPHWPGHRVSGQYAGTQPAPPGRPGAHCVHWKFYSRGNIKIFHKVSLMLILQLDAVVFVFWLSAWKFQNFVLH